jgi:hypothetical protein
MNLLIVLGLILDLTAAILLTVNAFTAKDNPIVEQITFGKLGTLLLAVGFLLQLLGFMHV